MTGSAQPPVRIDVKERGAAVVVRVVGDIDDRAARDIRTEVLVAAETHRRVVLDVAGTTFIASEGLGALARTAKELAARPAAPPVELVVSGARGLVRELLAVTRLDRLLTLTDTVEEALDGLG